MVTSEPALPHQIIRYLVVGIVVVFVALIPRFVQEHDEAFVARLDSLCGFGGYELEARILTHDGQLALGEPFC